jgi:hypothetical protein
MVDPLADGSSWWRVFSIRSAAFGYSIPTIALMYWPRS